MLRVDLPLASLLLALAAAVAHGSQFSLGDDDNITTATPTNVTTASPKKNEKQEVRGELWGILLSAVGFVIVAAMTVVLWMMARKKKAEAMRRAGTLLKEKEYAARQ